MLNRPTVKATATESPVRIRTADLIAVSPSGPGPASAPEARLPKPASGSRPLRAMATKLRRRAASTAASALQSGSRAAVKSRLRMRLRPQHHAAELLVGGGWGGLSRGTAVVEDEDAIAERAQLVEVERDDEHRRALGACVAQRVVDAAGSAEVETARRLYRDHQPRRRAAGELARCDQFLLVAAREIAGAGERLGRADVEFADQPFRLGAAAGFVDQRAARVGRIALAAEREVFLDAEGEAEGAAVAVFGQVDDAGRAGRAGIGPRGDAVAEEGAAEGAQAGEDFGELGLAVAVDAGHAEDFAATQREGETAQGGAVAVGKGCNISGFEDDVRRA